MYVLHKKFSNTQFIRRSYVILRDEINLVLIEFASSTFQPLMTIHSWQKATINKIKICKLVFVLFFLIFWYNNESVYNNSFGSVGYEVLSAYHYQGLKDRQEL